MKTADLRLITLLSLLVALLATPPSTSYANTNYEITSPAASNKIAVVILPDAISKAMAASSVPRAGQDMWLAVNFLIGNPSGLRIEAFPFSSRDIKVGVEGIVGEQVGSFAAGTGIRLQIRIAGHGRNTLYVSPGVDVYFSPPTTFGLGHYQTVYYVAGSADISWLHQFSEHFGFELGLNVGGEVALDAPTWLSIQHTAWLPELAIFTGIRF